MQKTNSFFDLLEFATNEAMIPGEQFYAYRLSAMKDEYPNQMELPAIMEDLSFDERSSMIVNQQYTSRREAHIKKLTKQAQLRDTTACLEHLDYDPARKMKKAMVGQLSDCKWVANGQNLIIMGATGVGKTYLLSAFGRVACMHGYKVRAYRMTRMLTDLAIGKGDSSYNRLIHELTKPDLLILDDFGMKHINVDVSQDLLEVIEERYHQNKSIGISAQLPVKEWPGIIMDLTVADAIMDRVVRNAYRF